MVRNDKVKEKILAQIPPLEEKQAVLVERKEDLIDSIVRYKKTIEIDTEMRQIKLKHYKRITPIFEYENDSRYQELLLENQKLVFEQEEVSDKVTLEKLNKSLEDTERQLHSVESNLGTYKKRLEKYE